MTDDHGIQPSRVTFNCLINGFAKEGNAVGAAKWFHAMKEAGLEPELCTYNCMVRAFALQGCEEQAESWFEATKTRFRALDATTYRTMMDLFTRKGLAVKVEAYIVEMERAGFSCGREAFKCVISAYASARDLDHAKGWCNKAEAAGFAPHVAEYTQLLKACGPNQDEPAKPDEGRDIFLNQVARGIAPDHGNMQALADALGQTACRHLCEELHVHTRAANLSWWPDPRDFTKPTRLAKQALGLSNDLDA